MRKKVYSALIITLIVFYIICMFSGITGKISVLHVTEQLRVDTQATQRWLLYGLMSAISITALFYMKYPKIKKDTLAIMCGLMFLLVFIIGVVDYLISITRMMS